MKTISTITLGFLLMWSANLTAQTTVKGNLQDAQKEPIPSVNVLLMTVKDSLVKKVALSDAEGKFEFKDVAKGNYFVKTQLMSFEPAFSQNIDLKDKGEPVVLPTLVLQEATNTLSTVEIVHQKPFLEAQAGRLVVNVANSIAGSDGSLSDVLRKVPGLLIVNNQVTMAGKTSVNIMIDGKPTDYMDIDALLRDLPADQIDRIEVISQPDARYDAAGNGGIINIIMKRTFSMGTNGNVGLLLGYGNVGKARLNASANRRQNGWNVYGNTSLGNYRSEERFLLNRNVAGQIFDQRNFQPSDPRSFNIRGGVDYSFDKKHTLGIAMNTTFSQNNRTNVSNTNVTQTDGTPLFSFESRNAIVREWTNLSADLTYSFDIDTAGQRLDASINHNIFDRDGSSLIANQILSGVSGNFQTRENLETSITKIWVGKVDYNLPIGKNFKLTTGVKGSDAQLDNNLSSALLVNNAWVGDQNFSNHYQYSEQIGAGYLNATAKLGKLEWQGGLRYEHTNSEGYSVTLDSTLSRNYGGWFPSSSLSYKIVKELAFQVAYSKRIKRPNYNTLNPYLRFIEPFTFERGNPALRPEQTQTGSASFTWAGQPFLNFEYRRTTDGIQSISEQDDRTRVTYGYDQNLARITQYGGHLFFPLKFAKGMDGFAGVMVYENIFESPLQGGELNQRSTSYTGFAQASYKFNKKWKMETNAWYNRGGYRGIIKIGEMYGVNAAIQGKFLEEKLEVKLAANNLFYKFFSGDANFQNQQYRVDVQWEPRVFELSLRYRFGNQFLKDKKAKNAGDDESNRASQKN